MPNSSGKSGKDILLVSALAGLIGGLCCTTPVVLVLLGLASISAANDLGNNLYGAHRWIFRGAALVFLVLALVIYFRRKGVCTLDQARRQRNVIINTSLVALIAAAGIYILWTYVVVQYWGIAEKLPWAQYDESWAIPASPVVLGVAVILYFVLFRRGRRTAPPGSAGA